MSTQLTAAVLLGLATAATPEGILAELVLRGARGGLSKGLCFALGLTTAVAGAFLVGFTLSSRLASKGGGHASEVLGLAVGVILIVLGVAAWRQPAEKVGRLVGRLLGHVDNTPLWLAFGLGTMSVNLVPGLALGAGLSQAHLPAGQSALVAAVFVMVGTSCVTVPLVVSLASPKHWGGWSERLRRLALVRGNSLLGAVLVAVGLWFTIEAAVRLAR